MNVRVASIGDSYSHPRPAGSWVEVACHATGAELVANTAVGGHRAGQIVDQLPAVVEARPDVCVVLAGSNDAFRGHIRPLVTVVAMWLQLRREGIRPVAATLPPHNRLPARAAATRFAFNVGLRFAARALRVPIAELDRPLGGLTWREGLARDGKHPSVEGVRRMGSQLVPALTRAASDFTPVPVARWQRA